MGKPNNEYQYLAISLYGRALKCYSAKMTKKNTRKDLLSTIERARERCDERFRDSIHSIHSLLLDTPSEEFKRDELLDHLDLAERFVGMDAYLGRLARAVENIESLAGTLKELEEQEVSIDEVYEELARDMGVSKAVAEMTLMFGRRIIELDKE